VPETFGLSSSSVSRRYVKATARKLAEFQERSLEGHDLVALFLDGKSFADDRSSSLWASPSTDRRSLWVSSRPPPKTNGSAGAS
jgi:hypothetical protein